MGEFIILCCIVIIIVWGPDRVFKYSEFVPESVPRLRLELKTGSSPNRRLLNDFSKSISVLAPSISVLVMNKWMNKPIVWNRILSPRTWTIISSPKMLFLTCDSSKKRIDKTVYLLVYFFYFNHKLRMIFFRNCFIFYLLKLLAGFGL